MEGRRGVRLLAVSSTMEVLSGSEEDAGSMGNEDSDYEYEYDGDEQGEDLERSTWLTDHYKTKRWAAKEAELREEMAASGAAAEQLKLELCDKTAGGLGCVVGEAAPRNVFSGAASFKVLAADLLALQHAAERRHAGVMEDTFGAPGGGSSPHAQRGVHVEAAAVDDNVYHWRVFLSGFPLGSAAQGELGKLERVHGYGHVELEVRFTIDLYPFFPPLVRLVRPRFSGAALSRVATLRELQLSGWNSVGGMQPVFEAIAEVLSADAALSPVDAADPRNDPYANPGGAYTGRRRVIQRRFNVCVLETIP